MSSAVRLLALLVALLLITIAVNYSLYSIKTDGVLNAGSLRVSQNLMKRMPTFVGETVRSFDAKLPDKPVRKYAFIKTHKTGSTTVWYVMRLYAFNILHVSVVCQNIWWGKNISPQ